VDLGFPTTIEECGKGVSSVCESAAIGMLSMLFPQSVPASNHHNGYTSGTEDCPFRVEAMPILPAAAIFPHPVHTSVAA
jgi:hypothetical protein